MNRFFLVPGMVALIACGGTVIVGGSGGGGSDDDGPPCCDAYPVCPSGSVEVGSCPDDTCTEQEACCTTILCHPEGQCLGYPSCDPGDTEVMQCIPDVPCYTASLCGTTISCSDDGLPQHGCPQDEPVDEIACDESVDTLFCDYDTGGGCFSSYMCDEGANGSVWTFAGGGCGI